MAKLHLALLGGLEARLDAGPPLPLARQKVEALLAFLALRSDQLHRRDTLAALLWAEAPASRARHSLRQALAELRLALAPVPSCLIERRDAVALNPARVKVDVAAFEQLLADGMPEALDRAVALYRGDLLEGLRVSEPPFEEWLAVERARLRELAIEALARLLAHHLESDALGPAVRTALRLLALDPLQEPVHRTLMRLYVRLGRRGAGLRQYQACLDLLRRELGAEPEPQTRRLYLELLQAAPVSESADAPAGAGSLGPADSADTLHPAPLVGRHAELAQIGQAYEQARAGGRPAVTIVGEAGIGKTRLIGEFVATLSRPDVRVLIGHAHETESDLPFGVWVRMFRDGGVLADIDRLVGRAAFPRADLARLFPELGELAASTVLTGDHTRLFAAVGEVVAGLARSGLLLVMEDAHWADEASLRLLAFLIRRITGGPLVVVMSAREEELAGAPVLRQVLAELDREHRRFEIALAPLDRGATASLVGTLARARIDPATRDRLGAEVWQVSEGNPFLVVETMRALQEGGGTGAAAGLPLPQRAHDTIASRLDRLTDRGRRLAGVAAAIGRHFTFPILQQSAGLDSGEAAAAVEELVGRRILHVVGEHLDFTHDWVRRTVYETVLPPVRPVVHAAIAKALAAAHAGRLDEISDELAHHYSRAADPAKAVIALRRFAEAASRRYAPEEAIRSLDEALVHAARLGARDQRRERIEVSLQLAVALSVVGRFDEILERLAPLRAVVEELGDPTVTGPYFSRIALTESILGRHGLAEKTARRALAEAERCQDHATLGTSRYVLAVEAFVNGKARQGVDHARRATSDLERAGDQAWLAQSCWILGWNHYLLGEFDAAIEAESRMEALAEALGDQGREATAAWSAAVFQATRGEIDLARTAARRGLDRSPDAPNRATARAILAMVDAEAADASPAIPVLEQAVGELDRFRLRQVAVLLFLAEAYRIAGRLAEARQTASRTRDMSRQLCFAWAAAAAERALGRVAWADGDAPAARRHLQAARDLFAAMDADFEVGRTHLDLAGLPEDASHVAPMASGQREAHLRAAHRLFVATRAHHYAERARRLATDLGIAALT